MKTTFPQHVYTPFFIALSVFFTGCIQQSDNSAGQEVAVNAAKGGTARNLDSEFKEYWYAGDAEITSYSLQQARYGELRDGHAVLIYVTEPFLADKQVKAETYNPQNIPVLKLNLTKKFITGIYPYSIMSSIYYPVKERQHAIKVSSSVQEWCGQVYTQLNNREGYEVISHSYFENEADQRLRLEKGPLEDEVWAIIRIAPSELPQGKITMVPALEYIRLGHKKIEAYEAIATLTDTDTLSTYEISYPSLERSLRIAFDPSFPYTIEGWTETVKSGFGTNAKVLTTRAAKLHVLKTAYWRRNGNKDVILRDSLGL